MEISKRILKFIHNPFPLWDSDIADLVIDHKWDTSLKNIFQNHDKYSITGCILKDETIKEKALQLINTGGKIQIAFPSDSLDGFYNNHGIITEDISASFAEKVEKINGALNILGEVKPLQSLIFQLVKSVQIIESENPETDISYSHPDIPFSIFFSLCQDNFVISNLRVAESILHESMHLYLTLIENVIPMIKKNDRHLFYSPWRNEERPLRGVLHGLFVFRAILDFYTAIAKSFGAENRDYILIRVSEIKREFSRITAFPQSEGLTLAGQKLSSMLLI